MDAPMSNSRRKCLKFGAAFVAATLFPSLIAFQDAAALGHIQPDAGSRWRAYVTAAPVRAAVEAVAIDSFDLAAPASSFGEPAGFVVAMMELDDASTSGPADHAVLPRRVAARFAYAQPGSTPVDTQAQARENVTPILRTGTPARLSKQMGVTPKPVFVMASITPNGDFPAMVEPALLPPPKASVSINLPDKELARAKKCLSEAIYFEARGEPERGQYAVAQVVMNRTRSPYYPDDVCGVVYENKNKRNRCQFSFACDGIPDRIFDRDAYRKAEEIADDVLVNGAYLPDIGTATHYHATYVRPNWIRDMVKQEKLGKHIFYNVRAWTHEGV
jgi:hypothetical protein